MSDAFWGSFFVAVPAIVAAFLAYRKSEIAFMKAEGVEKELRVEVKNGQPVKSIDGMSPEAVVAGMRLAIQAIDQHNKLLTILEKRIVLLEEDTRFPPRPQDHE